MTFESDSNLKRIRGLEKEVNVLRDQLIYTPGTNDLSMVFGNLGQRNAAHGVLTGLEAIQPITHYLTDVNNSGTPTGDFDKINIMSSNVLIDRVGFTNLELKYIQKTANNGQRIAALTVKVGKTLTLQTGGDLAITSDIILDENTLVYLVYSEDIGNKYRVLTSSSGVSSGANTALSNLVTTSINSDLIPQLNKDLGTSASVWRQLFAGVIDIAENGSSNASRFQIYKDASAMYLNVPTGSSIVLKFQGSTVYTISSTVLTGPNLIISQSITINDSATNPSFNGEFRRNGSDVKVFSGGAIRNLSDIISGGGANVTLSNLTNPTDINQSLIPQAGKSLGGSSNLWSSVYANNLRLGTAGVIDSTISMIFGAVAGMVLNVPTAKTYDFRVGGANIITFSSGGIITSNGLITTGSLGALALGDTTSYAGFNGAIYREGSDVKIFSGGAEKNITQIALLNAANIFTTTNIFNFGLSINAGNYVIFNNNDTTDTGIRQSTGVGITPKKLDLLCFSDIVFQGIGETTSARSRGMFRAMIKAGAPTTTEIPASFCSVVKNTSDGTVKLYYNDAGVLKSVTIS